MSESLNKSAKEGGNGAQLTRYPPIANSTPLQNPYFCQLLESTVFQNRPVFFSFSCIQYLMCQFLSCVFWYIYIFGIFMFCIFYILYLVIYIFLQGKVCIAPSFCRAKNGVSVISRGKEQMLGDLLGRSLHCFIIWGPIPHCSLILRGKDIVLSAKIQQKIRFTYFSQNILVNYCYFKGLQNNGDHFLRKKYMAGRYH